MSIDAKVRAIIENRKNNFYDLLDEFKEEGELCFPKSMEPDFAFEAGSDEERIYNTKLARFKALSIRLEANAGLYYTDDESSAFFGCSYDEIIGMANNGVSIPDEVLNWAYAMAEANPTEPTESVENGNDAQALFNSLKQNPSLNIKTITKIFVNKCVEQSDELESYLDELIPIEKELESARVEAETERNDALNKIKDLTEEWNKLKAKLQRGETLSDEENNRFEELRVLLGEEDKNYQKTIDNTTKNFLKIGERMTFINKKADTTYDFGTQTIEAARELAEFEKTNPIGGTLLGGLIGSGTTNVLGANGIIDNKRFSQTAHTVGLNTQYFSDDVNSVVEEVNLLMQATADVAGFDINDPSHTVKSLTEDESLGEPAPTTPEGEETTVEPEETEGTEEPTESEEPEQTEEEQMADGKKTLEEIDVKKLSLVELERTIKAEGKDSEKKGQDALKLVDKLKTQSETVDKKEEEVEQKTVEANEANEAEPTEGENSDDKVEEAQTNVETSQQELDAATEDEALTVEGLRETFDGYDKANKKYTKDVKYANQTMFTSILTGEATIIGGSTLTSMGITNISIGTSLLATAWMNPSALVIGSYLIELGSNETAVGAGLIASGTSLTLLACAGLEINDEAQQKIDKSSVNIIKSNKSLDKIERQQMEGLDGEAQDDEENDEEDIPMDERSKERALLAEMGEGNDILPALRSASLSDGKASTELGNDNVKQATILEKRTPELIETTITFKQTQQLVEEAPDADEKEMNSVQDPAEIYDEYREDYKADLETNNEYKAEIEDTDKTAKSNLELAGEGSLTGAARTGVGLEEISVGTALIAQWWNPVAVALGMKLIKLGTEDVALGSELLTAGLALTVNSTTTLAADEIANLQIAESDKETNESITRADRLEAEINTAVEKQLSATNQQDMSGMSVTELLTLIISNGITSSLTAAENTKLTEALKERLPELLEKAQANAQAVTEEPTEDEEAGEDAAEEEKEDIFAQYKSDFNTDLATNEQYTAEIGQARNMSSLLNGSFFFGAPLEKATDKIDASTEETTTDLEQVEDMEKQVRKAEEKDETTETPEEVTEDDPEDTVADAAGEEEAAANAVEEDKKTVADNEKAEKKEEKNVKKADKSEKKDRKKIKGAQKRIVKAEKETQELEKEGIEQIKQAEETQANANQDEAQTQGEQTAEELGEAETISGEVTDLAAEVNAATLEVQSKAVAATAENQAIVAEMNAITAGLTQDKAQIATLGNQIKQEEQKGSPAGTEAPAPEPQPQPAAAAPRKAPAAPTPEPPAGDEDDEPVTPPPAKAPAQKPSATVQTPDAEPTVANAPAGSDKIQFASDKEKQPSFVGFVAQSDSLASGSVLNTPPQQNNNNQNGGVSVFDVKNNQQNKKKAQNKKQKTQATGGAAAQQAQTPIIAANRTTQKPLDMNQMTGGGADKSKGLRKSAQAIQIAAFNKQNRLREMAIRANNNVMQRIAEEARAQAEAARKQRLAEEKQQRIERIKQFAGIVQNVGGLTNTAGMIVEKVGTAAVSTGTSQVTAGTELTTQAVAAYSAATGLTTTGTIQIALGGVQIEIGATEIGVGTVSVTVGGATEAAGITTQTVGTVLTATGTAMLSNPFTAAAGAALVASGTTTIGSGTGTEVSGVTLIGSGTSEIVTGTTTTATGTATVTTGTATVVEGTATAAQASASMATGITQIATGAAQIASGTATIATGATIQTIGTIVTAAGAATSAAADVANGNILGGIASIIGAAASVVGTATPVSQLGNAAMQAASQGAALAGLLTTSNAGQQDNGGQQNQKKKKQFKQNNRTEGIIAKTAQNKQAVGNRFNK